MKTIQIFFVTVLLGTVLQLDANAELGVATLGKSVSTDKRANRTTSKSKREKSTLRALTNYKSSFDSEANPNWSFEEKTIAAKFTNDEIETNVVYDNKGRWLHTVRLYHENKMPATIRELVKRSVYYDFDIVLVREIAEGDLLFYNIYLKNEKQFKQVGVFNGEMTVIKEFDLQ